MHQHSRTAAWPNPQNPPSPAVHRPSRTNHNRNMSDTDIASPERASLDSESSAAAEKAKHADRVRQVVQQFFKRAALTIIDSRVSLPPSYNPDTKQVKSTKWFQMVMDDSEALLEELADWIYVDITHEPRPPPLVIEIYLDVTELTPKQTLVLVDSRGKKWDACQALQLPASHTPPRGKRKKSSETQVVLERWTVWLDAPPPPGSAAAAELMPNVYKKAVVLFRSLYTYCRFLPTWNFSRRLANEPVALNALRPMYRIRYADDPAPSLDHLTTPLYPSADPTCGTYTFVPVKSPAGAMSIDVTYRNNCNFRIDDNDAYFSSVYRGFDNGIESSSSSSSSSSLRPRDVLQYAAAKGEEPASLPVQSRRPPADRLQQPALHHHYGSSVSTQQTANVLAASPASGLRAFPDVGPESPAVDVTDPQRLPPNHRASWSSKSSLRSTDSAPPNPRRVSVSFQPFKAGSLSSSPARPLGAMQSPISSSPSSNITRGSDGPKGLSQTRNRTSLTALPQTALRIPPAPVSPVETPLVSPGPASPKPPTVTRYSSSFGHRRSRFSSSGGSIGKEEDNNSSGKGSEISSKRNSAVLGEGEAGASVSSGSMQTDDDNISDFLQFLEAKKDLKSFNRTDDASREATGRRAASALSRYRGMRESNAALGESMSSSMMLHRSSTSSSQRLSGVPPTLAGASVSTSSSPGKAISPHTPHTPAVPSRLSEQLRQQSQPNTSSSSSPSSDSTRAGDVSPDASAARNRPIPIPMSLPRNRAPRRTSSQQSRPNVSSDGEQFDSAPANLSLDERSQLGLSELYYLQQDSSSPPATMDVQGLHQQRQQQQQQPRGKQRPTDDDNSKELPDARSRPALTSPPLQATGGIRSSPRPGINSRGSGNFMSSFGRGSSSKSNARSGIGGGPGSASGSGSASGIASAGADDDEPLLFTMSEIGRRSVDDVVSEPHVPLSSVRTKQVEDDDDEED